MEKKRNEQNSFVPHFYLNRRRTSLALGWKRHHRCYVPCGCHSSYHLFLFPFLCVLRNDLNTPRHREVDERYGKKYMMLFSKENERNKVISEEKQDYHVNPHWLRFLSAHIFIYEHIFLNWLGFFITYYISMKKEVVIFPWFLKHLSVVFMYLIQYKHIHQKQ